MAVQNENSDEKTYANEMDKHIQKRYADAINYYWGASRANKRWYKRTRSYTVILGALVTLIASLTSSTIINHCVNLPFIEKCIKLKMVFDLGTPVLAAVLTIVAGFSQSFQWGSTWQNMVLTAQQLQKEYDRYLVSPVASRNYNAEAEILNGYVINESRGFFDRMLGIAKPSVDEAFKTENGSMENGKIKKEN
jgi:hypothetical protein